MTSSSEHFGTSGNGTSNSRIRNQNGSSSTKSLNNNNGNNSKNNKTNSMLSPPVLSATSTTSSSSSTSSSASNHAHHHQQQPKPYECFGCHKPIMEKYFLKALDQIWHEDCLKCSCCNCRLGEIGSTLFTKADLILCKRDYLR